MQIPFFRETENSKSILIAGAGGGFDIASGIPLYLFFKNAGKKVSLANFSFTALEETGSIEIIKNVYRLTKTAFDQPYFPEKQILNWLSAIEKQPEIYAFSTKLGVKPLTEAYSCLIDKLNIDTLILVDGGTDSLMRGDETNVGSIEEDACSILAASNTSVKKSYLAAIGFGVEHRFNHHACLENISALIESRDYLGALSITPDMPEGKAYLDMVSFLNDRMPMHKSIITNSIAAAMIGKFGDYHATERTEGSIQFISALMSIMWFFDLHGVASKNQLSSLLKDTEDMHEIARLIQMHRLKHKSRPYQKIPLL